MVFFAVLLVVIVQHWLGFTSKVLPASWLTTCFDTMTRYAQAPSAGRGSSGVAQYVLIPTIVVALIFALVKFALGWFGCFILGIVWLWYSLHVPGRAEDKKFTADEVYTNSGHLIFARIFWFGLFGPVGLALYFFADNLQQHLRSKGVESEELSAVSWLVAAMDWIPVRLLGLTYALVGRFAETFKLVAQQCQSGLDCNHELSVEFAKVALPDADPKAAVDLVMRAVWVWVVVLAIVSIGMLL